MCFDIKSQLLAHYKRAKHWGSEKENTLKKVKKVIRELEFKDYHHVSAFEQPQLPIFTKPDSILPLAANWGFAHHNRHHYNAKSETLFKLETFKDSAESKRCVVYVNGFFEHHHFRKNTYPYFIQRKDAEPFPLAGIYKEWIKDDGLIVNTFTIITTIANPMMAKIHNNPALEEPRMPVILDEDNVDEWLSTTTKPEDVQNLFIPFPEELLKSHTVNKIRGKNATGNTPVASDEHIYQELTEKDQTLF